MELMSHQLRRYILRQSTVGYIVNGAIVEAEVPVTFLDQHNITIVLDKPDFFTVSKATKAIHDFGFKKTRAVDGILLKSLYLIYLI